jgi:hypothetical protein
VFHSQVFSYTLAICLGFGTQLYHVYQIPGVVAALPIFMYFLLLLYCGFKVIQSEQQQTLWKVLFLISLLITVLGLEIWLNFLGFVWLASINWLLFFRRTSQKTRFNRLIFIVSTMTIFGGLYLLIKRQYSMGINSIGSEGDLIFNYPSPVLALDIFWLK